MWPSALVAAVAAAVDCADDAAPLRTTAIMACSVLPALSWNVLLCSALSAC